MCNAKLQEYLFKVNSSYIGLALSYIYLSYILFSKITFCKICDHVIQGFIRAEVNQVFTRR